MSYAGGPPSSSYHNSGFSQPHGGHRGGNYQNRGDYGHNRRGGHQNSYNNRSGPYNHENRGPRDQSRNGGQRRPSHRQHDSGDINRYIKSSFFENPWHSLEVAAGIQPKTIPPQQIVPPALPPPEELPKPVQPDDKPSVQTSASRLGLSLPPPKQQTTNSSSKISNFLSKLPPPKSAESGQIETQEDL